MSILYLVRHGETVANLEGRIQGQDDSPLTPLGRRQAVAVARRLAGETFSRLYSSDLGRAVDTANEIGGVTGMTVQTDPLIRERHFGVIQGLTREEIEKRYPVEEHEWRRPPHYTAPPGAETHPDLMDRCRKFLDSHSSEWGWDEKVVIVSHGGALHAMFNTVFDLPLSKWMMWHFSNACLSIVETGDSPRILVLNDTCHLGNLEITDVDVDGEA
jgi:broad specificity phosphatase PhoE